MAPSAGIEIAAGRVKIALPEAVEVTEVLGPGVYALAYRGRVVYVGQSGSVCQRIASHRRKRWGGRMERFVFDQVFIWPCAVEDLDRLEQQMIARYQPRHNKALKRGPSTLVIGGREYQLDAR